MLQDLYMTWLEISTTPFILVLCWDFWQDVWLWWQWSECIVLQTLKLPLTRVMCTKTRIVQSFIRKLYQANWTHKYHDYTTVTLQGVNSGKIYFSEKYLGIKSFKLELCLWQTILPKLSRETQCSEQMLHANMSREVSHNTSTSTIP